jgi:hypothetical protein
VRAAACVAREDRGGRTAWVRRIGQNNENIARPKYIMRRLIQWDHSVAPYQWSAGTQAGDSQAGSVPGRRAAAFGAASARPGTGFLH